MWAVAGIVILFYLSLLTFEFISDRRFGGQYYNVYDSASNLINMIGYLLLFKILYIYVFEPAYSVCARFAAQQVPVTCGSVIVAIISMDFLLYWAHRLAHGMLWPLHHPHHSSRMFNLTTGLRQSWIHTIVVALYGVPFSFVGIPLELLLISSQAIFIYSLFTHTRLFPRLPSVVEYIFVTPSHHRVHHGSNPAYIDRNFGGCFIVWDRIFGTFAEENEAVAYGIEDSCPTTNPLRIQISPLKLFSPQSSTDP